MGEASSFESWVHVEQDRDNGNRGRSGTSGPARHRRASSLLAELPGQPPPPTTSRQIKTRQLVNAALLPEARDVEGEAEGEGEDDVSLRQVPQA